MNWTAADYQFMAHAIRLAQRGLYSTHPNPRVGCILVKNEQIVGEGWHEFTGGPHAEIMALQQAGKQAAGATCYVSLEPCSHSGKTPPCSNALIEAGISDVIAAMQDPNPKVAGKGLAKLKDAGITVSHGLLENQAFDLNNGFIKRMTQGLPYLRCKLAMSLDGRTAMANGESKWITGEAARNDVQRLRAASSAVITGIGTVLSDNPALNVREIELTYRQPLCVVLDRQLRLPADARLLKENKRVIVFTCSTDENKHAPLLKSGAEIVVLKQEQFLKAVLSYLAENEEINDVLLEAGAELSGAFLQAGFVDELVLYQSAMIMGDEAKGLFHLPNINSMQDSIHLELIESRQFGSDLRIRAKIKTEDNS